MNPNTTQFLIPIIAGTVLFSGLAVFIVLFIFQYRRAQQKFEWERQQFKQTLLEAEIEIREQTLKNISQELHDNFGQIASLIKINLCMMSINLSTPDREKVDASMDLIRRLIGDIKSLSASLNSENLKRIGFIQAVKNDCERINKAGLQVELLIKTPLPELQFEIEILLYRMSQEIFSNMLQHSNASNASLHISANEEVLKLAFEDNGRGFDPLSDKNRRGQGLRNLAERCKLLGAVLRIKSSLDVGTNIHIILSLTHEITEH